MSRSPTEQTEDILKDLSSFQWRLRYNSSNQKTFFPVQTGSESPQNDEPTKWTILKSVESKKI
jgi:hypothetical protein